ncbi:MAG TPA: class I SAM-dependent methyltransferase [Actinomycetes bacterium]
MDASAGRRPTLTLTGERTLPGIRHENYWFRRHEAAYRFLAGLRGPLVEAGCGEGYGAQLLCDGGAHPVLALDYDGTTVAHLRRTYPAVTVMQANLVALPLADATTASVVSLQTIEHLWDQPRFVRECARVLRPGGSCAVSTPNRLTFSPGLSRGEKPLNPFHANELDAEELAGLLAPWFGKVRVLGVHHGPRIAVWEREHGPLVAAQLATEATQWSPELTGFVTSVTVDDFVVHAERVDGSLDLLALATR